MEISSPEIGMKEEIENLTLICTTCPGFVPKLSFKFPKTHA